MQGRYLTTGKISTYQVARIYYGYFFPIRAFFDLPNFVSYYGCDHV